VYKPAKKTWSALAAGTRIVIALPPEPAFLEKPPSPVALARWAAASICHLGAHQITDVRLSRQWLNCSDPKGGLTGYFGQFIPDITQFSNVSLRPIPTTVVLIEITPPNHSNSDPRPKWPKSWEAPNGWVYEDEPIPDGREKRMANEAY